MANQSDFLLQNATQDMRILSFTTCVDAYETLIGLQFTLYNKEGEVFLELPPLGSTDGTCRTLTIEQGSIEQIEASFSRDS